MHTAVRPRTQAPRPHPGHATAPRRLRLLIGLPSGGEDGEDGSGQATQRAGEWLAAHFGERGGTRPAA